MKFVLFFAIGLAFGQDWNEGLFPRGSPPRSPRSSDEYGTPPRPMQPAVSLPEPSAPIAPKTKSVTEMISKASQRADRAERAASSARLRYHDTVTSFRQQYGAAHEKYGHDKENPAVAPERLYSDRRKADGLMKKVGKAQKNLANAYAKAGMAADEAGNNHRAERNGKKAESTAAHFYATKATYKTAKDMLKAKHFPAIATRTRARGKPGSLGKAERIDAIASKAEGKQKQNEYEMHLTAKRWRGLRDNGGRDTDSDLSDA